MTEHRCSSSYVERCNCCLEDIEDRTLSTFQAALGQAAFWRRRNAGTVLHPTYRAHTPAGRMPAAVGFGAAALRAVRAASATLSCARSSGICATGSQLLQPSAHMRVSKPTAPDASHPVPPRWVRLSFALDTSGMTCLAGGWQHYSCDPPPAVNSNVLNTSKRAIDCRRNRVSIYAHVAYLSPLHRDMGPGAGLVGLA